MAKKVATKTIKITYFKSVIGFSKIHKGTIRALGFHRLNQTVEKPDNPAIRGMLAKVAHLVRVEDQE